MTCTSSLPQPSAPPAPSAPVADVTSTVSLTGGQSLAQCVMEAESFCRTEAIGDWVEVNPTLAATLSPSDVALALETMSFSLDQATAAQAIASGITKAGGKITCKHVVKALGICDSTVRLDVAKGMAPFASDLVNEETILDLSESSYERKQVDRDEYTNI
jgi:hypothetical protein